MQRSITGQTPRRGGVVWTLFFLILAMCCAFAETTTNSVSFLWRDARELTVEGSGWSETRTFYDRLPARAEELVRASVWGLSKDSAGMCVRFVADGTSVAARWTLRKESLAMSHMPASGVSGLDLYVRDNGRWHWVGAGRPASSRTNEAVLVRGLNPGRREFALYLPLYNGVTKLEIGVTGGELLQPLPPRPAKAKPIVFYGTSIVQGGCAARPGMAYPAILGRRLDRSTINLGFSGNAHCEPEIAGLLAELDPAVFVLDPLPNMSADMMARRLESFVLTLREAHPGTPIVLVENIKYPAGAVVAETRKTIEAKNVELRKIYHRLKRTGQKNIVLVPADGLIGDDGEATVDGVHPTDVGFIRMADALEPVLRRALKARR